MCRLLMVSSIAAFDPAPHLRAFKKISKNSTEYQGHGWGCAWLNAAKQWQMHHHINPIWEDQTTFPKTALFLAHARSAFRDEGVCAENNMPFFDGQNMFIFNGELRGVRLKAEGRIGAEKIFNFVKKMNNAGLLSAVHRAVDVINKRTRYIRAMNFFIANQDQILIVSQFSESPDYFQLHKMHYQQTDIICSRNYEIFDNSWQKIENEEIMEIKLDNNRPL